MIRWFNSGSTNPSKYDETSLETPLPVQVVSGGGGGSSGSTTVGVARTLSPTGGALNAGADKSFTFSAIANNILVQNNSPSDVNLNFDATADAGSYLVPAGTERFLNIPTTVLHIYCVNAEVVNGSSGSNIVVKGWA